MKESRIETQLDLTLVFTQSLKKISGTRFWRSYHSFNIQFYFHSVKESRVETQLDLALAWNRSDVARDQILRSERRSKWRKTVHSDFGTNMLFKALLDNKHRFVQLLIDKGAGLQDFLTVKRLEKLYKEVDYYF